MPCCAIAACGRRNSLLPAEGMVFLERGAGELLAQRWHCYLCYVLPLMFPPVEACGIVLDAKGSTCELVKDHPRWVSCRSSRTEKVDTSTRDGDPKLAAEKVHTTVSRKKTRQGPLYVPSDRRV